MGTVTGMSAIRSAHSQITPILRVAALAVLCAGSAGCMHSEPFLDSGDVNGATIRTVPGDRSLADNLAQNHCAQYQRVARYIGGDSYTAQYECDLP